MPAWSLGEYPGQHTATVVRTRKTNSPHKSAKARLLNKAKGHEGYLLPRHNPHTKEPSITFQPCFLRIHTTNQKRICIDWKNLSCITNIKGVKTTKRGVVGGGGIFQQGTQKGEKGFLAFFELLQFSLMLFVQFSTFLLKIHPREVLAALHSMPSMKRVTYTRIACSFLKSTIRDVMGWDQFR